MHSTDEETTLVCKENNSVAIPSWSILSGGPSKLLDHLQYGIGTSHTNMGGGYILRGEGSNGGEAVMRRGEAW